MFYIHSYFFCPCERNIPYLLAKSSRNETEDYKCWSIDLLDFKVVQAFEPSWPLQAGDPLCVGLPPSQPSWQLAVWGHNLHKDALMDMLPYVNLPLGDYQSCYGRFRLNWRLQSPWVADPCFQELCAAAASQDTSEGWDLELQAGGTAGSAQGCWMNNPRSAVQLGRLPQCT